jgi:hypothetical protein
LANRKEATLKHAVFALASLLVAIVRCPDCAEGVAQAEWVRDMRELGSEPRRFLASSPVVNAVAETRLFSYPLNAGTGFSVSVIEPRASFRFIRWLEEKGPREW